MPSFVQLLSANIAIVLLSSPVCATSWLGCWWWNYFAFSFHLFRADRLRSCNWKIATGGKINTHTKASFKESSKKKTTIPDEESKRRKKKQIGWMHTHTIFQCVESTSDPNNTKNQFFLNIFFFLLLSLNNQIKKSLKPLLIFYILLSKEKKSQRSLTTIFKWRPHNIFWLIDWFVSRLNMKWRKRKKKNPRKWKIQIIRI